MLSSWLAEYTYANVLPERNSSSKLRYVYENGADSSNLKYHEFRNDLNSLGLFNQHVMGVSISFPTSLCFLWFYEYIELMNQS